MKAGDIVPKAERYTYFPDGSISTTLDRNGKITNYAYDIHGRLLSKAIDNEKISYTYDNNGNQLVMNDNTGSTFRNYDELGRVVSKLIPGVGSNTYLYDSTTGLPAGFYAEVFTDVKGNVCTKTFDKVGRLKEVKNGNGLPTVYEYNDNGSEKNVKYGYNSSNGSNTGSEEFTYYNDNLLHTLVNKKADGSILESYTYSYDNSHNQISKTDALGNTKYTYDTLNRLQKVTEPNGKITEYTFDSADNRESEEVTQGTIITTTTYSYNEQNRLTKTYKTNTAGNKETTEYGYDNNGNMTGKSLESTRTINPASPPSAKFWMYFEGEGTSNPNVPLNILSGTASYEYDVWNQLIKSSTGDGVTCDDFDGEGLRVGKTVGGKNTIHI